MINTSATTRRRPINNVSNRRHRPDYTLLLLSTILLAFGLITIYSIGPGLSALEKGISENYYAGKQAIAIIVGLIGFGVAANLPTEWWRQLEKPLIIAAVLSAMAVRLFGQEKWGATRWIQIGGFSFQAAELIKFALLVWLAGFLADRLKRGLLADKEATFKPLIIALGLIGLVVAKIQSDLGSTGVMVAMMAAMVFLIGLPLKRIMTIGVVIMFGTFLLIMSSSYRRGRVATFLNPTRDCQEAGYQACQALITVGSGGIVGQGLGKGVQAYGYLPRAADDSIFAIMSEKMGFIGVTAVLGVFVALFTRMKNIIERTKDPYNRLLVTGILAWLSTQTIINVGAMIGLLPLKGITLPLISYGGTSIIFVLAAIGVVFQISRYTSYSAIEDEINETSNKTSTAQDNDSRRRFRGAYRPGASSRI